MVKSQKDLARVKEDSILVTVMTNPDMVPAMKRAAAIVTDEGGRTCHAAIVSRELGIPCIVGTGKATKLLKEGMEVTVDATRGVVYEGRIKEAETPPEVKVKTEGVLEEIWQELVPVTATKIYMNLGELETISRYKHLPFDGIGLMRTEFIFTNWIGVHLLYLIKTNQEKFFIDKLAEGIFAGAQAVFPRSVVVRFSDFRTNEFRGLKGGEEVEPIENNPMIRMAGSGPIHLPSIPGRFSLRMQSHKKGKGKFPVD